MERLRQTPPSRPTLPARIVVLEDGRVTGRYVVEGSASVGRANDATIVVHDAAVSRHHARITPLDAETYEIEDLGSRNGVFVNGVQVRKGAFRAGDNVTLGKSVVLKVSRLDPVEEDLRRRERLETLGRLTAGIIHDLNNMLGAVLATAESMRPLVGDSPELAEGLANISTAAGRAAELTPRLMGFVRGDSFRHGVLDLSRLCREVVELLRHTLDPSIEIRAEIAPALAVQGDMGELHQALMNLCLNARDAMREGGVLTIRAGRSLRPTRHPALKPNLPYLEIQVTDTGHGMDAATLERVFEAFFSTKGQAGFGLGLSSVKEIVTLHGGLVDARSTRGVGTTFDVFLPEAATLPARTVEKTELPLGETPLDGDTVLVVDDEECVRTSVRRLLRLAGASVLEAEDGASALRIYDRETPDVVLLDLGMPGMSGEDALRALRGRDPDVCVVILTGDIDDARVATARALGARAVVVKPFTGAELANQIATALGPRPSPIREPITERHLLLPPDDAAEDPSSTSAFPEKGPDSGPRSSGGRRRAAGAAEQAAPVSGAPPLPNFEALHEPSSELLASAADCARIAMKGVALDMDHWTPEVEDEIARALQPLDVGSVSLDALLAFLLGQSWPLPFRFELGRLRTPHLGDIRPPMGVALVAALTAKRPRTSGLAVVLVHGRPTQIYDPDGGGSWRVPKPDDQIRWFRGRRHVLLVRGR